MYGIINTSLVLKKGKEYTINLDRNLEDRYSKRDRT